MDCRRGLIGLDSALRAAIIAIRQVYVLLALVSATGILAAEDAAPKPERFAIWPNDSAPIGAGDSEKGNVFITVHLPPADKANGAAMVICPGGGYQRLVDAEGNGIAQWLVAHGIAGIVLEYRMPHGRPYVPLLDAQRAIRTTRARAGEWKIDPQRIGIIGFSAGGHLASTAGTHFDDGKPGAADPIERASSRPDFMVLVYPVITMTDQGSALTRKNLLGVEPKPELLHLFSNEEQVTDQTPPTFLAHAVDDKSVPAENSRMFHEALKAHHVATHYLELPSGGHGLNGLKGPMWEAWKSKSLEWLVVQKMLPAYGDRFLPRYLFIGDSISGNYDKGLRAALHTRAEIHHPPGNCQSSTYGRKNIVEWLGTYRERGQHWNVISFNFGHWDDRSDKASYQENLEAIVAELKKTDAKLIWVTTSPCPGGLPPAGDLDAQGKAPGNTSDVMKKYLNPWAAEVMARHPEITICDQWQFVTDHRDDIYKEWWKGSDVHFKSEAADALGDFLAEHVGKVLSDSVKPKPQPAPAAKSPR